MLDKPSFSLNGDYYSSRFSELSKGEGDTLILNLGPQHPSTHGVLRVIVELDGEYVHKGGTGPGIHSPDA